MAAMDPQPEMERPPSERIAMRSEGGRNLKWSDPLQSALQTKLQAPIKDTKKWSKGHLELTKSFQPPKLSPDLRKVHQKNVFAKNITLGSIFFILFEILT